MNLSALGQRALGESKLYLKKHGPAILTGAGVVGFVGTTVLVAKAAVKAKPVLDDAKHGLKAIENQELDKDYTRKQQAQDYGRAIADLSKDMAKIYAPALILGGISITCVVSAHGMLKKQNTALVAAYGALDLGFRAYRQRVIEELGPEKEQQIYRGVVAIRDETLEDGQVCQINEYGDIIPSIYGRFFDETSAWWNKNPEYNLMFLSQQQKYANDLLIARGHLFLNEVYDALGLERSQMGQIVGWKIDRNGKSKGDGHVDFGMYDIADEVSRAFINGIEKVVFLDFNVDGPINID